MANQLVTDLEAIITLPDSGIIHVIDTTVTTQNAAGSSFKITKENLLKENTAAILLNTAKVGITPAQATAITNNTSKVGYTEAAVTANTSVAANTVKVGITPAQTAAIGLNTANTSKVSINTDTASLANVRSLRYREETYSSNLDMVMQSSVGVYAWVNVFTVAFNVVNSLVTRFKNRVATDGGVFSNQTALETFLGTITGSLTTVLAAITPNAVKAGKLYSVIPNTSVLDATVVRNTTATTINSAGIIVLAAANVARISHTLNTGGEGFILDEPQRTNLSTYSSDATNVSWDKNNVTVTENSVNSPDGTLTADRITPTTTDSYIRKTGISLTAGQIVTYSFYAKYIDLAFSSQIKLFDGSQNTNIAFNVTNSADWQRITATFTASNTALYQFWIGGNSTLSTGKRFDFWGAQIEIGSGATSQIPTVALAVTRNADIITVAPPSGTVKITTTFSNNTTQVLTAIPAIYTMPEGLIKSVNFNNTL